MAFTDSPEVDDNSKKSEESVLKVKSILSQRNGFISREEFPDYGVDLDVELILDGNRASSQKFAVQIKSIDSIQGLKVDYAGETFISYTFKTSRLGYICQRPPGYGIIVLYDDATEVAYYDYLMNIVSRIDEYNSKDWRNQKSVQIYLSPKRVLDKAAAEEIHATVADIYTRHAQLLQSQGHLYRIPSFGLVNATAAPFDIYDLTQVAQVLREHGGALFNQQDFRILLDLLERLPASTVSNSASLSFIAAVTYGQTGRVLEGDFYIAKCLQVSEEFSPEEIALLNLAKIQLDFVRGSFSLPVYSSRINELTSSVVTPLNKLTLRINSLYLDAIEQTSVLHDQSFDISKVDLLLTDIAAAQLADEERLLLNLYASDILQVYISNRHLQDVFYYKMQEQVGIITPLQQRKANADYLVTLLRKASGHIMAAQQYANANDKPFLLACSKQYQSRFFLTMEFNSMMLTIGEPAVLTPEVVQQFRDNLFLANEAYNQFIDLQLLQDAYQSLLTIHDMQALYQLRYNQELGIKPLAETKALVQRLGRKLGASEYNSAVEQAFHNMTAVLDAPTRGSFGSILEEDVDRFARVIVQTLEIPIERLPNVITDIQNHRLFEAACQDPAIVLLHEISYNDSPASAYIEVPNAILRNLLTGAETQPFKDVRQVLDQLDTTLRTPPIEPDNAHPGLTM